MIRRDPGQIFRNSRYVPGAPLANADGALFQNAGVIRNQQGAGRGAKRNEQVKNHSANVLSRAADAAKQAGVPCDTMQVENARPYEAIIAAASDRGCDLIVMGSHGRGGLSAVVLGSVTTKVLTHTKTPVLVYR